MDVHRMASDNLILIVESIWSGLKMYVASWYFDQFFKKNPLTFSRYCLMCMFICYYPHYSFGETSKIFDQHRWWSLSSLLIMWWRRFNSKFNSQLTFVVQFLQSHIMIKNMLLLSHYRFVTHQNVSSFLRNRLVQKIKILRIFLKIEICRRQSYGILLFNFGILAWIFLNAF